MTDNEEKKNKIEWKFCPGCGTKLPSIERLRFCIKCGVDLKHIKEHKTLPPTQSSYPPSQTMAQPSYAASYPPYKKDREMLSDEEILHTKDKKLWGNLPSIGLPLLGFLATNGLVLGILIILIFIVPIDMVFNIISNPFFLVLTMLVTYALLIFPLWYAGKYLQNPKLKNRLTILGFTSKGYDMKGIFKEVLIGLAFAGIGIFLVVGASVGIQLILEYVFGVSIMQEGHSSDTEVIITGMDILVLILMIIMMILVVGPAEEACFRGFMMKGLNRTLGKKGGLFLTAFIFASLHLVGLIIYIFNPVVMFILFVYFFVPYFAISIMLGLLFNWRDENLIACIICHGVYNSITIIIVFLYYVHY